MRESLKDPLRLDHIVEAANNVIVFMKGKTAEDLASDKLLYFAVVKNLEIIGEAAYKLTIEFKESHPETAWKEIVGMRHILVHGYYHISCKEVWDASLEEVPKLLRQVLNYLEEFAD